MTRAPGAFYDVTARLAKKAWGVYCKRPFAGAQQVYAYLARYTHRVGLSNFRLQAFDGADVTFKTRGDNLLTLPVDGFLA